MNLSNQLSIFRIILIPFFILSLASYTPQNQSLRFVALGIFLLAVISDAVDGYLARRRKQRTTLGTFLDPLADKLILISAFFCLLIFENLTPVYKLPFWFLLLIISRDAIIVLGSLLIHMLGGNLKISPTPLGKVTTSLQMLSVIIFLLQLPVVPAVMYLTAIFTVASGIDYIRIGSKYFNETQM